MNSNFLGLTKDKKIKYMIKNKKEISALINKTINECEKDKYFSLLIATYKYDIINIINKLIGTLNNYSGKCDKKKADEIKKLLYSIDYPYQQYKNAKTSCDSCCPHYNPVKNNSILLSENTYFILPIGIMIIIIVGLSMELYKINRQHIISGLTILGIVLILYTFKITGTNLPFQ